MLFLVVNGNRCNASLMSDIGFPYVADCYARILILGSLPGRKSLREQQYYAHGQNSFWPIMGKLFGFSAALPYAQRLMMLRQHHIALWDVAHCCERPGSLDKDIAMDSVLVNDFTAFFAAHCEVKAVFFNGRKAQQLYQQEVGNLQSISLHLLPSTSPTHASMRPDEKLAYWGLIKQTLESA